MQNIKIVIRFPEDPKLKDESYQVDKIKSQLKLT